MRVVETCPVCGGDLMDMAIATYPPIPAKQCNSCGWRWEGKREEIVRVLFDPAEHAYGYGWIPPACRGCSNHPSNGGSGVCNCTLGSITIT